MLPGIPGSATLAGLVARLRSLWRGLHGRGQVEADMAEEFRQHVELRTEDLIRAGLAPREAARTARLEFGHIEGHKEDARASRGLDFVDQIGFSWLDVKLGMRMFVKYPGLSLVSVVGMSVAIAIGAGGFGLIHAIVDAPLPLDEGERVVSLQNSDVRNPSSPDRRAVHDFLLWREDLGAVRDLSAFRDDSRNLSIPGGSTAHVRIAQMTASGFRVARVAPVLGRPLLEDDERAGAPPVVVIGYQEWQRRFEGDPSIIGRVVRLDTTAHTVVGVMPEGFQFPVDHSYWVPLQLDPAAHEVGGGPAILMFGRLADGVSVEQAQSQLIVIGRRMAAAHPETHERLRPWVWPYTHPFAGIDSPARVLLIRTIQIGLSLLLVVVSVNVAILVYARTAARTGEIAVRTALGASRRRVVTQLFAEALVLTLVAAVVGLSIARLGFDLIRDLVSTEQIPFWIDLRLSPALVAYTAGLAVLAATIVGVVPALKATGRAVQGSLQHLTSRGSRMQLGRMWTALIVVQVAVAVAVLPYALYDSARLLRRGVAAPDYPIDEYLQATLSTETETARPRAHSAAHEGALAARFAGGAAEMVQRLEAQPEVAGVTFASRHPGSEAHVLVEVEDGPRGWTWMNRVDTDLFTVFDAPILAGRGFVDADAARGSNTVVVDRVFVERLLGGGAVLGRRVRELNRRPDGSAQSDAGPWLEIVGVVPAFTPPPPFERADPKLYHALALADAAGSVELVVRTRRGTPPATFLARVREIAHSVDPTLRVSELRTAADAERPARKGMVSMALGIVAITGSVLLLSAAGIYAMMSFTVASRRREIGIRSALGAAPRRVLSGIFARAGAQLGTGALIGLVVAEAVPRLGGGSFFAGEGIVLLPVVAAIIITIGLLAALGPARRGLAIQPTEALRAE